MAILGRFMVWLACHTQELYGMTGLTGDIYGKTGHAGEIYGMTGYIRDLQYDGP